MNKSPKVIYLILILTLSFSCFEKKSSQTETSKSEVVNPSKTDTLKFTSRIRAIFQDSKGNYWFGSHQEGVCRFDGKSFEYFTTNEGLADNQVRSIQEDNFGNIWFGTSNGVSSYDGKKITNHAQVGKTGSESEWEKTDNDLWFNAGNNSGVYRYDGQKLEYLKFPLPKNKNLNDSYGVTAISKGQDGKVWIATYAALFYFDGKAINVFEKSKLALSNSEVLHIRSILADSQGRIWIGNNGIGVLLNNGETTINFSAKMDLVAANSSKDGSPSPAGTLEHVFVIEEDSQGNIWFGDRDTGAWKFDGKTMTNYTIDAQLSTQMVWDIYEDNNKNLLFAMENGSVYQFNGKSFEKRF
jgi:ligand-binding sensor domain-containing protein